MRRKSREGSGQEHGKWEEIQGKNGNEEEAGKVINDRKQVENSRLRNLCAKYTEDKKTCTKFCEMIGWFLNEQLLFRNARL